MYQTAQKYLALKDEAMEGVVLWVVEKRGRRASIVPLRPSRRQRAQTPSTPRRYEDETIRICQRFAVSLSSNYDEEIARNGQTRSC